MKELSLPDFLVTSLASGHPWVYRDHVGRFRAPNGSWVRVRSGSFSAVGLWDEESAIAVRIFSTTGEVDDDWVRARVKDAWDLRSGLRAEGVTGYRLIFGEADALPGIVVDMYGPFAILVSYSKSLGKLIVPIARAVLEVTGCSGVVRRHKDGERVRLEIVAGEAAPDSVRISEYDMVLEAELCTGQKTGLFFDHRENRRFVRAWARDRTVLNLFSYTGGFSVAAALGGARSVTSVDIAAGAIAASERNMTLNALGETPHRAVAGDVFEFLEHERNREEKYQLVVCDPPSFAKNKQQLRAAEKAYRRLFAMAFSVVEPGGLLCAASCTSQVGPVAFRNILVDAARKAKVRFSVVHDVGQPVDHPVSISHEEGRYLKFVAGRVTRRV